MDEIIYNPLEEYEKKFKQLHYDNVNSFFSSLVEKSQIDVEQNIATVKKYEELTVKKEELKKKCRMKKFLRVLACISLILIPYVIKKMTPQIKELESETEFAEEKANELLVEATEQMEPLNNLFTDKDALSLIEKTLPLMDFKLFLSAEQEMDMKVNYDFDDSENMEQTTFQVLSGRYNENPFLFENKLIHTMGSETYHGYKNISWIETYRDSNGKLQSRRRTQTLHASVVKPKPFYNTQVVLNYGAQGGAELTFTRDATHLEKKSEKAIERYVKSGEKKLKRLSDKAIKNNGEFVSMSNSEFEVLFDALDRNDEVQYRTLFTPLAQTNMVDLILSKTSYGDDFAFIKNKRMNKIISNHSQGREINILPEQYKSYSYEIIKNNFISKNIEFFKAVYFDFAPILAIPVYQERPVHSLKPIPALDRKYAYKEYEVLANSMEKQYTVHPDTKTSAILKSRIVSSENETDETVITAYSYDIEQLVDIIPVRGGDGYMHDVPVYWDNYIPLEQENRFFVTREDVHNGNVKAKRNGLCIY